MVPSFSVLSSVSSRLSGLWTWTPSSTCWMLLRPFYQLCWSQCWSQTQHIHAGLRTTWFRIYGRRLAYMCTTCRWDAHSTLTNCQEMSPEWWHSTFLCFHVWGHLPPDVLFTSKAASISSKPGSSKQTQCRGNKMCFYHEHYNTAAWNCELNCQLQQQRSSSENAKSSQ